MAFATANCVVTSAPAAPVADAVAVNGSSLSRLTETSPRPSSPAVTVVVIFMGGAPILASACGSNVNPKDTDPCSCPSPNRLALVVVN